MKKIEADKIIKQKIKELLECPFCGNIPKIDYRVDKKHINGSMGHFVKRLPCCDVMGSGQVELFFCNNNKPAEYELWARMACLLVDAWNYRSCDKKGL